MSATTLLATHNHLANGRRPYKKCRVPLNRKVLQAVTDARPQREASMRERLQRPLPRPVRNVNLFDTDLTPRTDLAALPARAICERCGTHPVSVTMPLRAVT